MITDADIKKMKTVFVTKDDLEKLRTFFATKDEMYSGFQELVKFIGETRIEIVSLLNNSIEELKDITRRHQMTLENHNSRIDRLEYLNK